MIFSNIAEVKESFGGSNINNDFDTLLPYLDEALNDVIPYLSMAQWEKLVADYETDPPSDNEDHLKLLKVVRKALIHFAYLKFSDDGTMQISDKGFMRIESDDEKSAYSWMMTKFVNARIRDAWANIWNMLKLLNSDLSVYPEWAGSSEYEYIKSFFLWNMDEFRKYRSMSDMRTLDSMRNSMIHVQEEIIKKNIGQDMYDELKNELFEDDFSDDNKEIIPFINKAIAHLSTARAIDEGFISFNEKGLTVKGVANREGEIETPAEVQKITLFKNDAQNKGIAALKELREYLNKNASATKYPGYFTNTDLYDDPTDTVEKTLFTNKQGSTFFAV